MESNYLSKCSIYWSWYHINPFLNSIILLPGAILVTLLADWLDFYYVIKLEENIVESIKTEHFVQKSVGPKLLYTIGTIVVTALIIIILII